MKVSSPLLSIRNLCLDIPTQAGMLHAVRGIDLTLHRGRTLCIVGESGSGKSLTALSILGLQPRFARRTADEIMLGGIEIGGFDEARLAKEIRGKRAAMIFQEPMTSLNPVMTIGDQLAEVMTVHGLSAKSAAKAKAITLLERTGISGAASRLDQYPHQFSGGQRQRVMIAMALMSQPELLIADEPTTALDVTVQAEILRLLAELRDEFGMSLILITHNLGVVSRVADDVLVMYAGQTVETAPVAELFENPRHPYTRGLLASIPQSGGMPRGSRLETIPGIVPSLVGSFRGCAFAPRCGVALETCHIEPPPIKRPNFKSAYRCVHEEAQPLARPSGDAGPAFSPTHRNGAILEAQNLHRQYVVKRGIFKPAQELRAVNGVDLSVKRGEILAIVGESGCGKSTLGRLLLGLELPSAGTVLLNGNPIHEISPSLRAKLIQPVFQDPRGSLNPRRSVREIIRRPLDVHDIGEPSERDTAVLTLMKQTGLPARLLHTYPGQLSGGQRQRVAIARALVIKPEILLCDEPTSALDVSVQAQVINLLLDLKDALSLTFVLITHDLSLVQHIADRVVVMYLGQIVEERTAKAIFREPLHPYTRALMQSALPVSAGAGISKARIGDGFPNPLNVPKGCVFSQRCLEVMPHCNTIQPLSKTMPSGFVRCHLFANEDMHLATV